MWWRPGATLASASGRCRLEGEMDYQVMYFLMVSHALTFFVGVILGHFVTRE